MEKFILSLLIFIVSYFLPRLIAKVIIYFKSKKQMKGD